MTKYPKNETMWWACLKWPDSDGKESRVTIVCSCLLRAGFPVYDNLLPPLEIGVIKNIFCMFMENLHSHWLTNDANINKGLCKKLKKKRGEWKQETDSKTFENHLGILWNRNSEAPRSQPGKYKGMGSKAGGENTFQQIPFRVSSDHLLSIITEWVKNPTDQHTLLKEWEQDI